MMHMTFQLANERILNKAKQEPQHNGMGCTAELLKFFDQAYVIGHVGDSRVYLFRQGQLRQITKDHSLVQEQLEQGLISTIEAKKHSLRHLILRAVGINDSLAVDFIKGKPLPGDIFLLCSCQPSFTLLLQVFFYFGKKSFRCPVLQKIPAGGFFSLTGSAGCSTTGSEISASRPSPRKRKTGPCGLNAISSLTLS